MMSKDTWVPEGYKKTDLGVIPEEWGVAKLEDCCEKITDGFHNIPQLVEYGIPLLDSTFIDEKYNIHIDKAQKFISEDVDASAKNRCKPKTNDILISSRGSIGKLALVKANQNFNIMANIALIRPNKKIDSLFLLYCMSSEFTKKQLGVTSYGSSQKALYLKNIKDIKLLKVPLPEQQKIASILSKVDEQIEQTEQIIEKTELLKKGLMQKLLTKGIGHTKFKKTELGKIPEEWEVTGISQCCSEIFLGLTSKVDYVENDGIPLIRASDINNGYLSFDEARLISKDQHHKLTKYRYARRGDILISKSGSLGVCALVDTDIEFSIYESIIDLQPIHEKVTTEFLLWLMRDSNTQKRLLGNKVGSTVGHLNLIQFRSLKIILPPLEEQQKIASILSKVDYQIQDNQNYLTRLQELKKGLMQDLLTGKVRVCV